MKTSSVASQKFGSETPIRRDERGGVIQPAIPPDSGDHPEKDRRDAAEERREQRQFKRRRHPQPQFLGDRCATAERRAEIAVQHMTRPLHVLHGQGRVEAVLMTEPGLILHCHALIHADQKIEHVPRQEPDDKKVTIETPTSTGTSSANRLAMYRPMRRCAPRS